MIEGLYKPFQSWSEKGAVFVIADLHLGESEDLRQAYPNRPTDEELMIAKDTYNLINNR